MIVIMGIKPDGTYKEITVNEDGSLAASPPAQAITRLRISKSTSGDSTLIAAPAGALCIYYELLRVQNYSDSPITAQFKFGAADTNYDPVYMATKGDGYTDAPPRGYVKLPPATPLILNLDVTGKEVIGHVRYWIAE